MVRFILRIELALNSIGLLPIKRQSQNLDHLSGDQMPPFFGDIPLVVLKPRFGQQMDPVAADHCFPVQSVRLVQHLLGGLRLQQIKLVR